MCPTPQSNWNICVSYVLQLHQSLNGGPCWNQTSEFIILYFLPVEFLYSPVLPRIYKSPNPKLTISWRLDIRLHFVCYVLQLVVCGNFRRYVLLYLTNALVARPLSLIDKYEVM